MSAQDLGSREWKPGTPGGRRGSIVAWVAAAVLAGAPLGMTVGPRIAPDLLPLYEARIPWTGPPPAAREWPHGPRTAAGAALETGGPGTFLVARAPTPEAAEELARELGLARLARSPKLVKRRDPDRARWAAGLLRGPAFTLSPTAECAALLRGFAEAWRAALSPSSGAPADRAAGSVALDRGPSPAGHEVTHLALASDVRGLALALDREALTARALLFARAGSGGAPEVATAAWRSAWGRRAAELESIAEVLETPMEGLERELIARVTPGHALAAERIVPDPAVVAAFAASGPGLEPARPVASQWALLALAGVFAVLLVAAPTSWIAARVRRSRLEAMLRQIRSETGEEIAAVAPRRSVTVDTWLHVVSGLSPRAVASAVREMAARLAAGGERVLVIDGARHLRLHDSFGARPHLGFQECMRGELPLLGVVQNGGVAGLFVLAHGGRSPARSWFPLDGLLEQARLHFVRVVLALDPDAPREVGSALAGRLMTGWWVGPDGPESKPARRLSERLGAALAGIEPALAEPALAEPATSEPAIAEPATVESLADEPARAPRHDVATAAAPALASAPAPAPTLSSTPALAPAPTPTLSSTPALAPAPAAAVADAAQSPDPVVLDCDPQVRERLRFLMWMRRLRARSRGQVAQPIARG
ncbi:MAG TPA: hypothetical protein VGK89_03495 [Candidatus Eisenbacteria bacterium]|jgi:hypothetical protein